ncbi:MAG: ATP-binding protein, partial [Cyanobacteria bacterium J06555_13]
MSDSPSPHRSDEQDASVQIDQVVKGDRNQTIGQVVLGGLVVYGQVIIKVEETQDTEKASSKQSELGQNPYKGLLAFHEKDGDRFFGRDTQIEQLWQQFRGLHDADEGIRLLPIYGPSGSGKSSLARAGLIPELARQPLPGRERARVAVLVPGTHPLEALATVLAQVATDNPFPTVESRKFQEELIQTNVNGDYDGLRRIADMLPNIVSSPLIVLVDQLEEIYTLCADETEQTAFVRGLLCAASDRAKRVSVIVTMRSDFLGETHKSPELNRLFSEQGCLVPVMNKAELRDAIRQPAKLAGYALDEETIARLIYETVDREGALPLLQFALSQIWEGIEKRKLPADTLEELKGVGGALANKAEQVYAELQSKQQQVIARRIFSGLVQLGEGTRDTRRRVEVEKLVSKKDEPAAVQQVLRQFTAQGVRLISCSATKDGPIMAEVTHEALFDHWERFKEWLKESRDELRFQRRLEVAATDWAKMDRPEGKLWRSPDLDLLCQHYAHFSDEMSSLEVNFFT